MRVLARICASVALMFLLCGGSGAQVAAAEPSFDPAHRFIVVTFANEPFGTVPHAGTTSSRYGGDDYSIGQTAFTKARRVASKYSLRQVASWPIKELGVHCVVYEITDSRTVADVVSALAKDPRVSLAQPLQEFHTLTDPSPAPYNDPLYGLQSNLLSLGISAAHARSQGAGVRVGLIDTGVDTGHADLHERITGTHSFIAAESRSASAYRHGTAMAGLIAAVANNHIGMVGIAPLAQIEVFEACWQLHPNADEAACNTFTLAKAIAAALEARLPLINLSIAGPPDPLLAALVRTGVQHGVIFVGSIAEATSFPTNVEGVIAVGGNDDSAGHAVLRAPANHVLTLRPGNEYDFASGTSVAAAEVTGIIALLLSADSHFNTASIVALLESTASGIGPTVDASAALVKLDSDRPPGRFAAARSAH